MFFINKPEVACVVTALVWTEKRIRQRHALDEVELSVETQVELTIEYESALVWTYLTLEGLVIFVSHLVSYNGILRTGCVATIRR